MKFKGHGHIWNPDKNKMLCSFSADDEYETEDEYEIKMLRRLGYENDGPDVKEERIIIESDDPDYSKMTVKELREIAKTYNIKDYSRLKKDELINLIK